MGKIEKYWQVSGLSDAEELEFSKIADGYANGIATLENIWQFFIKLHIILCMSQQSYF